ncbi:MAG: asparagine synthase (glutamine-hydrolyzing), partial [Bacteroidia bacterium]
MCGIVGVISKSENGKIFLEKISAATDCLAQRGPDDSGIYKHNHVALGHRRLSIIDVSDAGAQPMSDPSGRFTIIFNGEFFNFKEHRKFVLSKGIKLFSESDTEVLLQLYILEKEKCLERVNGFFSLAIYDKLEEEVFIARDRFGVKPLLVYEDDDAFMFSSEMKALMKLGIKKELDGASLLSYFQLNYIPSPHSIFKNIRKLSPGTFLKFSVKNKKAIEEKSFYTIPYSEKITNVSSYHAAQKKLYSLLDAAVQRRLISDVPLGSFLSGGVDSSVISGLASKHTKHLKTFSIGFRDEPMFDETQYAQLVAKKHKTDHTVFSLTNEDLFEVLHDVLNYIDEPFADSSALNVFILSRHTRKHVTVALSGDGADELFGGYNKHRAEWLLRNDSRFAPGIKLFSAVLKNFSGSRNTKAGNRIRQIHRFAEGMKLSAAERYWRWCGFTDANIAEDLFLKKEKDRREEFEKRKSQLTKNINGKQDLNDVFYSDVNLVLQSDMLTKVDLMSMANSLEVRTPFLDYEVVDFAFALPSSYKIDKAVQKKIVKDAFKNLLPEDIYNRKKQGFEVPLLKWFRTELKSMITDDLLNDNFIREQNLFNP